jgi:Concanavalin A-like lectin/glucanases superfamily
MRRRRAVVLGVALLGMAGSSSSCTDLGGLSVEDDPDAAAAEAGAPDADADAGANTTSDAALDASRYADEVRADNPVGYWRLGEAVPPVAKDATGQHDGVYAGGLELGLRGAVNGDPNTAARFNGQQQRVEVTLPGDYDFAGKAPFSVELWMKREALSNALLGKSGVSAGSPGYLGWQLVMDNTGTQLSFRRDDALVVATIPPAPDATFHHVVATYDSVTMVLYLDGVQVAASTQDSSLTAISAHLLLGQAAAWGTLKGLLDEVALYKTALPATRVRAHHDAALGK